MDVIALLCNLHADGPATLRLLRRAGLTTAARIEAEPYERLAEILGTSPAAARRFAREAQLLAQRAGQAGQESGSSASPRDEIAVARATASSGEARVGSNLRPRNPAARLPAEDLPPSRAGESETPLRQGTIDGLDAALCERLVAQGVRTLESFVAAPGPALARRLGVSFARLLEMQCLARRQLIEASRAKLRRELLGEPRESSRDGDVEAPLTEYSLPRPDFRAVLDAYATRTESSLFAETAESVREDDYELARPDPFGNLSGDPGYGSPFADETDGPEPEHELDAGGPFA